MTVAAFLYDDYYCHGPKSSFAGIFDNEDEAKEFLRGGRFEKQNLETMNLETYAMKKFVWQPLYELIEKDDKKFLEKTYNNEFIELGEYIEGQVQYCNEYGQHTPLYYAGYWSPE